MPTELSISQRRTEVKEILVQQGFVSLSELAKTLNVSESTARRDLEVMEEQGVGRRTHGGAVCLQSPAARLGFDERQTTAEAEKKEIARQIAAIIPDGQTVILDGGTTCYQVALELKGRPLLVVTNSVPIAALLSGEVKTEITLIGGYLYPRTGVALGTMAEEMLKNLRAAQAVMSCAAVNPDGLFNANEMMASIERRMMEVADEVIVGVDHTKLSRRSIAKVCGLDRVDVLVTDGRADESCRQWLSQGVKRLIVAEQQA